MKKIILLSTLFILSTPLATFCGKKKELSPEQQEQKLNQLYEKGDAVAFRKAFEEFDKPYFTVDWKSERTLQAKVTLEQVAATVPQEMQDIIDTNEKRATLKKEEELITLLSPLIEQGNVAAVRQQYKHVEELYDPTELTTFNETTIIGESLDTLASNIILGKIDQNAVEIFSIMGNKEGANIVLYLLGQPSDFLEENVPAWVFDDTLKKPIKKLIAAKDVEEIRALCARFNQPLAGRRVVFAEPTKKYLLEQAAEIRKDKMNKQEEEFATGLEELADSIPELKPYQPDTGCSGSHTFVTAIAASAVTAAAIWAYNNYWKKKHTTADSDEKEIENPKAAISATA